MELLKLGRQETVGEFEKGLSRLREGKGSIYVLMGEAGMGKSRVISELSAIVRDESLVFKTGEWMEGISRPYSAFFSALAEFGVEDVISPEHSVVFQNTQGFFRRDAFRLHWDCIQTKRFYHAFGIGP